MRSPVRRDRLSWSLLSLWAAGAIVLAACGSAPSSNGPKPMQLSRLVANSEPACEASWLTVSVPHPDANNAALSTTGSEQIVVKTTRRCTLRGWPSFERVPASRRRSGIRARFQVSRSGRTATVLVLPTRPAAAQVSVSLPARWVWGGGNLCAGFVSALVELPGIAKSYFVFDASPVSPLCGMPDGTTVDVAAAPFRAS